jgi:LuxR family maltose regulon positive regulatory protein
VQQRETPTAWLSLDADDNDPVRFWNHFMAAIRMVPQAGLQVGKAFLQGLQRSPTPDPSALFGGLIQELAVIPGRFSLVLDDAHLLSEAEILDGLFYLLENLPGGMSGFHLVVSSRNDPPWPLARLRVRGQLVELRARDLRFTHAEAARFLNEVMQLGLTGGEVAELEQRTEGWVAGLQMASLSMRGREDVARFLDGFSGEHRFVLDYLVEEVLSRQPQEVLVFLLQTSILARLTGPLCAAVTGEANCSTMLLALEKANMFLVALDDERRWYRYHHLFADLLQKQLGDWQPAQVPLLHRRASEWYARHGYASEAVAHACQTGDWDYAARQVEASVFDTVQRGEMAVTRQWLRQLPDDIIRQRPVLCVAQAWVSAKYADVATAEALLAHAEGVLSNERTQNGGLDAQARGWVDRQMVVLQVILARTRGDSTQQQQALALEALERVTSEGDSAARATLYFRLGLCYLDLGKDELAEQTFAKAVALGRFSGNRYAVHAAGYGRMVIARLQGRLNDLMATSQQALQDVSAGSGSEDALVGIDRIMAGMVAYEWGQLERAEADLERGLELVEQVGITELIIKGQFALACTQMARGKLREQPDLVGLAANSHSGLVFYGAALQALVELRTGDTRFEQRATQWAEKQDLRLRGQSTYDWDMQEKTVLARVLCRQGQVSSSAETAAKLREISDFLEAQRQTLVNLGWWGILLEVEVVLSRLLQTLGRHPEALAALERGLGLAAPQRFVRTFVDEGEPMRELLRQSAQGGSQRGYARELLRAFPHSRGTGEMPAVRGDWAESFSQREMQVLSLLNTQLSVPEIAAEIHLAPTTVRTHVQHIYRKLGVHSRIEALQRGEELGLL